jgi:enoyl-CoA hydratase/carnithine racemase/uncharacterized damage-inducible protein DinB
VTTETLALLEADRRGLIAAVERVPEADRGRPPAEGRWSVGQVLEHLIAVERSVTKLMTIRGREPIPPDNPPPIPRASERVASLRRRDRRIEVPDQLRPAGTMTVAEALAALSETRAALLDAARAADPEALARRTYHHAVLGRLALVDWLAFIAHHEARHTAQIDEIAGALSGREGSARSGEAEHVTVEQSAGVLTLTLNRPEKKNALTAAMYSVLGLAIDQASNDPEVRCILIQGNGDSFTAGNDLAEFAAINAGERDRIAGNALITALARANKPIVAAVQGRAVGVGATMLLHCDLVYVTEDAKLSTPFVGLGLVPEAASSVLLPARLGHARAFAMFVLGEVVDGATAVAWGLANTLVPAAALRARARAAAEAVAAQPPEAAAITKRLMRDGEALAARIAEENRHFTAQLKSPEAREAFAAFREKRRPDFRKHGPEITRRPSGA